MAPPPLRDAGTAGDTATAGIDGSIEHSNQVTLVGGAVLDAEPAGALDAQSAPMNGDPAGIPAYVFTLVSKASSDDVP